MKHELAVAANILAKSKLPTIPNEVAVLQDESMRDHPNSMTIAQCISRNPKLLTKFLAVASFVSKKDVTTAKQAVDILGIKGVFTLFFSSAIEFSFESTGNSAIIINHAIKVAVAMAELASKLSVTKSDCYLYGLLYNIGYVVLHRYDENSFNRFYIPSLMHPAKASEEELKTYRTSANYIGVYVAKKWHVKNAIYCAILFQSNDCPKGNDNQSSTYELVNLLHIARSVVAHTEDDRFVTEEIRQKCQQSMQRLGIGNADFVRAQSMVKKHTKDLQSCPKDMDMEAYFETHPEEMLS